LFVAQRAPKSLLNGRNRAVADLLAEGRRRSVITRHLDQAVGDRELERAHLARGEATIRERKHAAVIEHL
jgi:hypothetical protein